MHQLLGQRSAVPRGSVATLFMPLLILSALAGATYFAVQTAAPAAIEQPAGQAGSPEGAVATVANEDLLVHVQHVHQELQAISENARKAQDLIRQVAPNLERNFMSLQKRRLESADSYIEFVRRDTEEALEEVEMVLSRGPGR